MRLCCHSSCRSLVVFSCQLVAASPLVVLSLHRPLAICLVAPGGCHIDSHHPLVALPSCSLVAPAGCHIAFPHPLVVPPTHPVVAPAGCCITSRCTTLSSSRCLIMPTLFVSLRQLVVTPSSLVVLSLHCPLALSSCCLVVALPLIAPPSCSLIVVHCQRHRMPLNAAAAIEHHRYHHH